MLKKFSQSWSPLEWGERILKVSGVLALFGYMSLRAHFNFIGLSGAPVLTAQQYLMETYRFGAYVASVLAPVAIAYLFLISVLPRRLWSQAEKLFSSSSFRYWIVPAIALGLLIFGLRMLQLLSRYGTDLAIGPLRIYEIDRNAGQRFCGFSMVCIAGIWFLLDHLSQSAPSDRKFHAMLKGLSLLLAIITLQLPILYGYYVHSTQDPLVSLTIIDDKQQIELCGLLVLDTGSDVLVWNSIKGSGQVQQIPKSRIKAISYLGQADLLSAIKNSSVPKMLSCNSIYD